MQERSKQNSPTGRRTFLFKAAALLTASVAVAAPATSSAGAAPREEPENPDPESKGYHPTEHIRTYYEKVRF